MTFDGDDEFDPSGERERTVGRGFLEEESSPGGALAHLYRGEVHRMKMWRERLDRTSNWAVTMMAAILTWAFSRETTPHFVILIGVVMLTIFLVIEARRYRGYDIWRSRVRLMQENVWAYALNPAVGIRHPDWRRKLSDDYLMPTAKITYEEALAHRLRRVYLPMFGVMLTAWVFRITMIAPGNWPTSAAVGMVPGVVVTAAVVAFVVCLAAVTFRPRSWQAKGELREQDLNAWNDGDFDE